MVAKEVCNKLDISKNVLVLSIVGFICGFIIILSLIICVALDKIDVAGVKELMGIFGTLFASPGIALFIKYLFVGRNGSNKEKK